MKTEGLRGLPSLEQHLDGIERFSFGGTCYPNNYYFNLLLRHLGYKVTLCGADMTSPDVHIVSLVRVEGSEYLVDVGYGAPFMHPLPRELTDDYEISTGRDRYVLEPQDNKGCSRLTMFRDGQPKHGYLVKPVQRSIEDFYEVISESFDERATFMNAILLVRFFDERWLAIHNQTIVETSGTDFRIRQIPYRSAIPRVVEEYFSIPRDLVAEALDGLSMTGDAWS
jgi:arylamine N-acetyltransferase